MEGTITGPRPLTMVRVKDTIRMRLEKMVDRYEEIGRSLADPAVIGRQREFRDLSVEYARLTPVAEKFGAFRQFERELNSAREMTNDSDPGMREMGAEEVARLAPLVEVAESELKMMLIPRDPRDDKNIYLEVRAGTGGDEAAIFAGDLFRMYARYAEAEKFTVEILSENPGEHGGYREIISRIAGNGAFARFKFESGVHRVQRVPATEAQGRIHTSACTVAILVEPDEVEAADLNPAELRVDTYRASGAGGQHVNKTESAIRITHLPTGLVVECQDERSQHKNRSRAMALMKAKVLAAEQEKRDSEVARNRKLQVGTGDRSERIRTYNFPQGRVTDHRINLTLYKLGDVLQGRLTELMDALQHEYQAEQLAEEEHRGAA
jgi:peptide chain release factor 1